MQDISRSLSGMKVLMVNGEDLDVSEMLSSQRMSVLRPLVAGYDCLFIDEAQHIPGIGRNLKLLVDSIPELSIMVTGSATLDLREKLGEPLAGRGSNFYLFPLAQLELGQDFLMARNDLETRLIYGCYPQVYTAESDDERTRILESIHNGVLLKDLLMMDNMKDATFILNLLRLIAFQIGNDASLSELANRLGVSKNTVARYIDLLEKCQILFSMQAFSRNLRNEISKSKRYFFWDNGIRNAVISNFNRLSLRDDAGRLWENYCISERMKRNHYKGVSCSYYFWRTYQQREIDLIEESAGHLRAFEFKLTPKSLRPPPDFIAAYPHSSFEQINRDNYLTFIA
jgi:predicted AAA+ superfamily ATPase